MNCNEILIISNPFDDHRFKNSFLELATPYVKFFISVPIFSPENVKIGFLCIMDTEVNRINDFKNSALYTYAKIIFNIMLAYDINLRSASSSEDMEI